eukprot:541123-Rhodomonas_salina.2
MPGTELRDVSVLRDRYSGTERQDILVLSVDTLVPGCTAPVLKDPEYTTDGEGLEHRWSGTKRGMALPVGGGTQREWVYAEEKEGELLAYAYVLRDVRY